MIEVSGEFEGAFVYYLPRERRCGGRFGGSKARDGWIGQEDCWAFKASTPVGLVMKYMTRRE